MNSEAQYWVRIITHQPDAIVPIRNALNVIKASYQITVTPRLCPAFRRY